MKRYGPKGSVSIFLSCVLLTLIVFTCTIVDMTRIHVGRIQAERALSLASESILASYDSQLQSQYGIFAKDFSSEETILSDLNRYTLSALNPSTITTTSNVFNSFSHPIASGFTLYEDQLSPMILSSRQALINSEEVKEQILDYMAYRAPFIALEPFLEKMGMLNKASKTSEIIGQKNDVISEIHTLEVGFYDLEMLIDGIEIDGAYGSIVMDSQGNPSLYPNYIKKLVTKDVYSLPIYTENEIPLESYRDRLNQNIWLIDQTLSQYKSNITSSGHVFSAILMNYKRLQELIEQIEINALSIARVQQEIDRLTMNEDEYVDSFARNQLQNVLSELHEEAEELAHQKEIVEQAYHQGVVSFNAMDDTLYASYLPQIQNLTQTYVSLENKYGLKGMIEEALLQIELIKAKTPDIATHIKELKVAVVKGEDTYIEGTTQSIQEEIKKYEKLLGLNDDGSMNIVNNLYSMETTLQENLVVLSEIDENIRALENSRSLLQTFWYQQNKQILSDDLLNEILQELHFSYDQQLPMSPTTEREILAHLDAIEASLDGYSRELYFDYSTMDLKLSKPFDYDDFVKASEGMFPGIDLPQLDIKLTGDHLPSKLLSATEKEPYKGIRSINIEASSHYLDQLKRLGEGISKDLLKLKDELYLNEYILGMFKMATDNLSDEEGKKVEAMTFSHFPKDEHYLNYEVEYILFGNPVDATNLLESVATLFAVRIALNLIALLLDYDRMSTIRSVSDAVAGWWSLGIGSIIMTSVLTLIWAMLESVSDVQNLLKGERVPILKNSDTWKTDPLSGLANAARVDEQVQGDEATETSYLPSLCYEDYLRLFLLGNQADETTKCYRILDLIQMNMSKERGEEIRLESYVTGFEAKTSVEINPIFFKLSFMPARAKEYDAFHFDLSAESTY